jgi:predicted dithiol-disulfide oxidoreductase (DUF899 family)
MNHKVVNQQEWQETRRKLLESEKEHTRGGDQLARQRQELPWVRVEREYRFDTDAGSKTLAELFDGRSQLLIYHFMFGANYQAGDATNSSIADSVNGLLPHLHARDVTMLFVSRAPIEKLRAYKRHMGWEFPWVADGESGFSMDYGSSSTTEQAREWVEPMLKAGSAPPIIEHNARATGTNPVAYVAEGFGFNSFVLDDSVVYLTYSTSGRGVEFLMGYYPILDRSPKGRDERAGFQMWLRRHDEYT